MQHYVPEDRNIKQCHCENLAHVQFYSTHTSNEFDRESGVSFVQVHVPSWLYRAELREQVHPMWPLTMSEWWRVLGGGCSQLQMPVSHRWVPYHIITTVNSPSVIVMMCWCVHWMTWLLYVSCVILLVFYAFCVQSSWPGGLGHPSACLIQRISSERCCCCCCCCCCVVAGVCTTHYMTDWFRFRLTTYKCHCWVCLKQFIKKIYVFILMSDNLG